MPVDLPQQWLNKIDLQKVQDKVEDYAPFFSAVKKTWDTQTLEALRQGKISIPDEAVNRALENSLQGNQAVSEIKVTSLGEGKIKIAAVTESLGRVKLTCKVDEFRHDQDATVVRLTVLKKSFPDQKLMSLLFSHVSLAMVEKMVGNVDFGDQIQTSVKGNTVTLDVHRAIEESEFGKAEIYGQRLMDALIIEQAVPQDGYIEFKARLDIPDSMNGMLGRILG